MHELEMTHEKKTNVYTPNHKLKPLYYYECQKKIHCPTTWVPRRRIMK
jgi:hypothetical protein